ncbi:hypothetical protein HPB49_021709 [Dermacentor silvarum]|uniref:Uncharacterized protein n=1 Tax=Dermacentor silvarum TaxID=543639 RepID=A0ACB8CN11_DERSI|nr:hypothetical protein HPB49_021709 [Dermacentor silvarum]
MRNCVRPVDRHVCPRDKSQGCSSANERASIDAAPGPGAARGRHCKAALGVPAVRRRNACRVPPEKPPAHAGSADVVPPPGIMAAQNKTEDVSKLRYTDLYPFRDDSGPTREFLQRVFDILWAYVDKQQDRSSKILEFHMPEELMQILDLELPDESQPLQRVLGDCAEALKHQVRTGGMENRPGALDITTSDAAGSSHVGPTIPDPTSTTQWPPLTPRSWADAVEMTQLQRQAENPFSILADDSNDPADWDMEQQTRRQGKRPRPRDADKHVRDRHWKRGFAEDALQCGSDSDQEIEITSQTRTEKDPAQAKKATETANLYPNEVLQDTTTIIVRPKTAASILSIPDTVLNAWLKERLRSETPATIRKQLRANVIAVDIPADVETQPFLKIEKLGPVPVQAYVTPPRDAIEGVIYGVSTEFTDEDIRATIRPLQELSLRLQRNRIPVILLQEMDAPPTLQLTGYNKYLQPCIPRKLKGRHMGSDLTARGLAGVFVDKRLPQVQIDTQDLCTPHREIWGYRIDTPRGRALIDAMEKSDFNIANVLGVYTRAALHAGQQDSTPDLTRMSQDLRLRWQRQENRDGSDHHPILLSIENISRTCAKTRTTYTTNWDRFRKLYVDGTGSFLDRLKIAKQRATKATRTRWKDPAPDLHMLNLIASRLRAQQQAKRLEY